MKKFFFVIIAIMLTLSVSKAQEGNILTDGWKISGMAHLISQMDGKDFSNKTHPYYTTTSKIRLGVEKHIGESAVFRVDFQDSRLMGTGFFADQNNVDILQGFVELKNVFNLPLSLQAGRFQMQYGTERIIGRSLWHYQERTFDGVRLKYSTEKFKFDWFQIAHTNSTPYMLKVMPSNYPYPADDWDGYAMYGFWSTINAAPSHGFDLFGFVEDNGAADMTRFTTGANYNGKFGKLKAVGEFAYQFGTQQKPSGETDAEQDIAAYLASLKLIYNEDPWKFHAGADILSGTDPDGSDFGTYVNYPASKHKFLGLMDYFLVTTKGTGNLGVNDYYAGITLGEMVIGKPITGEKGNLETFLTFHYFMSNQESPSGDSDFGQEIDFVLKYTITKGLFVQFGGGVFLPGEVMKKMYTAPDGTVREDPSFWAFTMLMLRI